MAQAQKSKKRENVIETICEAITHREIFETIDYKNQSEDKIKQFTYPILVNNLTEYLVKKRGKDRRRSWNFVKERLLWEGNIKTTVHHTRFMGTMNRPDMIFEIDAMRIAIEFKRGDSGGALRSGLGQSLIYSTDYDFTIFLFIDTSENGKIKNCRKSEEEESLIEDLWNRYNIKFIVV
jgi:hypothetical protein